MSEPFTGKVVTTNTLSFIYNIPEKDSLGRTNSVPILKPHTYEEAMLYIQSKRIYDAYNL